MNTVELIHFSLSIAFEHFGLLVKDLTQEQIDWMPPGKANTIGSLYWHTIAYVDQLTHERCMKPYKQITAEEWLEAKRTKKELGMGQTPLRFGAGWQEKVVLAFPPENPEDPFWDVRNVREGLRVNLEALHDYAKTTEEVLLNWVVSLTPEDLDHMIQTPFGDFSLDKFLEYFIIWHINTHCGEIAALMGCQGLKGYPW